MKQDKRRSDEHAPEVTPQAAVSNGIDFLVILQAGAGLLCLVLAAWVILKYILHVL